ncbi:hypothetical protein V6N13_050467 [Hibiscus sabdariffa]|uniref:Uncharacterized protein n=1 Tax=Hibiscus sabdariffa TaxID=183260 RepID=A0ABR2PHJ9_9ROSI
MSAPCFSCAEDCRFYLHKAIHSISFGQRVVVNSVVEEEDDEEEEMSSGLILVDLSLGKLMTSLRSYYIMRGLTKV